MGFPLRERVTTGYGFLDKTSYSNEHLGQDYRCHLAELLAPFDGEIIKLMVGIQGGKTIWFKRDNQEEVFRFMHNNEFKVPHGEIHEGRLMAITGDTGIGTWHLHIDIARSEQLLNDFLAGREKDVKKVFIDPEKYDWESNNNDKLMENVMKKRNELWQAQSNGSMYWVNEDRKNYYKIDDSNSSQNERVLFSFHVIKTIDKKHEKHLEDNYKSAKNWKEVL